MMFLLPFIYYFFNEKLVYEKEETKENYISWLLLKLHAFHILFICFDFYFIWIPDSVKFCGMKCQIIPFLMENLSYKICFC